MNPEPTPPTSELAAQLARTEAIKAEMTQLLAELEQAAIAKSVKNAQKTPTPQPIPPTSKPGGWRHHPTEWAAGNLAPEAPPSLT